jgi:polysaccharide export outer membrane protein
LTSAPLGEPIDRIGIDDTFDVRVYGEPELTGLFRVATDGPSTIRWLGASRCQACARARFSSARRQAARTRSCKDPQVSSPIKDRNSQKISGFGPGRRSPGRCGYYPNMTIVDAIASAGGFTGIAAKNSVNLRREVGGKIETHIYPVADITEGARRTSTVLPGDVLVVDERVF